MKSINELLIDIIYMKKRTLRLYVEELENTLGNDSDKEVFVRHEIAEKQEENDFLETLENYLMYYKNDGIKFISQMIKNDKEDAFSKISKKDILKQLFKEYKIEYKKHYFFNKKMRLSGVFDNNLFCEIIKKKIDVYTNCNRVTKKKYVHLTAFLNELLCDMQNSDNPLKTLRHRMKIYTKYEDSEYVEIRNKKVQKSKILMEILEEYNKMKIEQRIVIK